MYMYIQSHENWFTDAFKLSMLQILNKFKSNNSCINDAILIILYVHHYVMMIHIQFKFHEILFIGYFVTAQFVNFTLTQGQ